MGAVILVAYGALWLSTRGQHPYKGPSLGVVGLVYAAVAVSIAVSVKVYRRATAGVSGPSREAAAGRRGRDPDLVPGQPRDSGRDEALRRQQRDRLRA